MATLLKLATRWSPSLVLMIVIFAFSSIPKNTIIPNFGPWEFEIKKGAHLLIYGLLANTYLWSITNWRNVNRGHSMIAILLAAAYGVSDELHQRLVPGRISSVMDVCIDTLGAILGISAWWLIRIMLRHELYRK